MRAKLSKTVLLAAACVAAVLAFSGAAAGSASAAGICVKVTTGEPSMFTDITCKTLSIGTSGLALIKPGKWMLVSKGILCAEVEAGEEGMWTDNKCTTLNTSGKFVKIKGYCLNEFPIAGQGSSLQKIAQNEVWIPESDCPVTYTASGSAEGLKAFGVGTKTLEKKDTFIGTDDAPNGSFAEKQLKEMEEAAKGEAAKKQDLVIPVAQAAIAVIFKAPKNCSITKSEISNANLQEVFNGKFTKWSQLANATGSECATDLITRVVRKDGSGTTYQFKHYLFTINEAALAGTGTPAETWEQLQPETTQNLKWPEETGVLSTVVRPTENGNGGVVKEVEKTEGAIGYANLSDARKGFAGGVRWFKVEKEGGSASFPGVVSGSSEPTATTGVANCSGTNYGTYPELIEPDQDWSKVYGGHKNATNYPICTLTWDVALMNYTQAEYTNATEVGPATEEYMEYITKAGGEGQTEIANTHDYEALPTTGTKSVQKVAEELAKLVNK